ncbi:uncharacterized protein LOC123524204 [Mercenaria mercenaria]|uniref:uncharacterized protein LOC123524204 n=1 Tax=Mercenaria mercenaria TaxID=6596 RepID=UPI00234E6967|nr:uncharacterized protein LOC123524204 [Mercenaria mercenaria]
MKSCGRCDVEISVTFDGMETVEPVPECLQEAFLSSSPTDTGTSQQNHVTLPSRYAQWINNCTDAEKQQISRDLAEEKPLKREKDLSTALEWIKQEMVIMKQQDKSLMKQFVTLRSKILQLRCIYDLSDSYSDLSLDASTHSLDDRPESPYLSPNGNLGNPDIEMTEFRSRTSSLLIPRSQKAGPITRIKWKSHEYL